MGDQSEPVKPTLGVYPRQLFMEDHGWNPSDTDLAQRFRDVLCAIVRRKKAGQQPCPDWVKELRDIRSTQQVFANMGWSQ